MWRSPDELRRFFDRLRPEAREQLPHTARLEVETPGVLEEYTRRFAAAFAVLREQVQAYKPDALIMIGDDQGDMFDEANNPIFSIYTGEEPIWGTHVRAPFGEPATDETKVVFQNHAELARYLHKGLVKRNFDVANLGRFVPRGNPGRGVSHMVANLVPEVDPTGEIPIVCVFINEYYPPLPSAERRGAAGPARAHRHLRLGGPLALSGCIQRWLDRPRA
jgi:protocatechuate 4,5-dioxygenase beta chain